MKRNLIALAMINFVHQHLNLMKTPKNVYARKKHHLMMEQNVSHAIFLSIGISLKDNALIALKILNMIQKFEDASELLSFIIEHYFIY